MLESVMLAVHYVESEKERMEKETGHKPTLYIEKKVHLEEVGHGTADIILYHPFGLLHVMDFKNGQSIVDPIKNTQGLYYGHGAADLIGWDFREIWITIIQPNANHKSGPIRTWKTTPKVLEKAGQMLKDGAKKTRKKDAPLIPDSKWCYFCTARIKCPEQLKLRQKKIMDRFKQ
jgi:hypothetical protein